MNPKTILLILVFFLGCKDRQQPAPPTPSPQPAEVAQSAPPDDSPLDTGMARISFPKTFVMSKDEKGRARYVHVGGWSGEQSQYFPHEKYDVMTTENADIAGQRIDVFFHIPPMGDTLVVTESDSIIFTVGDMGTWFDRVVGDYLAVSLSTGPGPEGLWIYDLTTGKRTCNLSVSNASWDGFRLTAWGYSDSVATAENCPEFNEWVKNGDAVEFEEMFTLDIRTCERKRLGVLRCMPRQ